MNATAFISLCVIAKNEEHCLARCLRSAQMLVDEIIVVDTGSTDSTAEIAINCGASVFIFEWNNDFAAARNYAISKAAGTWILVLDADETLSPLSREELHDFIQQSPAEGYYFRIRSYLGHASNTVDDYVVRLFKNAPQYRFAGAIHEQIAGSIQHSVSGNRLAFAPFTIEHYGYSPQEIEEKRKFNRNTAIIQKALAQSPQDPFLHYSLGIEYLQNKNFCQAGEVLEQTIALLRGDEGYIPQVIQALLLIKLRQPEADSSEQLFRRALLTLPENGDIYCLYGVWLMQRRQFSEAAAVLEQAMAKNRDLVEDSRLSALLGDAYFLAGVGVRAVEYYANAFCVEQKAVNEHCLEQMLILWISESHMAVKEALGRILTSEILASLLQRTKETGRLDLSLATLLLAIIERLAAGDMAALSGRCSMYCQLLKSAIPASPVHSHAYAILSVGAEELMVQENLIRMCRGHIRSSIQQGLLDSAVGQLALVASLIREFPADDPLLFWQEVFLGETCANCQSG